MHTCLHKLARHCRGKDDPEELIKSVLAPFKKNVAIYCDYIWGVRIQVTSHTSLLWLLDAIDRRKCKCMHFDKEDKVQVFLLIHARTCRHSDVIKFKGTRCSQGSTFSYNVFGVLLFFTYDINIIASRHNIFSNLICYITLDGSFSYCFKYQSVYLKLNK